MVCVAFIHIGIQKKRCDAQLSICPTLNWNMHLINITSMMCDPFVCCVEPRTHCNLLRNYMALYEATICITKHQIVAEMRRKKWMSHSLESAQRRQILTFLIFITIHSDLFDHKVLHYTTLISLPYWVIINFRTVCVLRLEILTFLPI